MTDECNCLRLCIYMHSSDVCVCARDRSDPEDRNGLGRSVRGAGVHFGPDVTKEFLDNNNLSMVIRSHECVRRGFELPFSGANAHLLGTIFSASNYSGGDNEGAYMVFATHMMTGATHVKGSGLYYFVRQFKTSEAETSLVSTNMQSLQGLILKKRSALHQAFLAADTENSGMVSKLTWAEVMTRVTQIQIRWLTTLPIIAPDDVVRGGQVAYGPFLASFSTSKGAQSGNLMDAMYAQRTKLEAIFHYFDRDGNGTISRAEFRQGCELLNTTLPPDQQLTDFDHILDLMDFDQSNSIDINEFFEVGFVVIVTSVNRFHSFLNYLYMAMAPLFLAVIAPCFSYSIYNDALILHLLEILRRCSVFWMLKTVKWTASYLWREGVGSRDSVAVQDTGNGSILY